MIKAIKNGVIREFTENTWKVMPRDKWGWQLYSETPTPPPDGVIDAMEALKAKQEAGSFFGSKSEEPSFKVLTEDQLPPQETQTTNQAPKRGRKKQ